MKEGEKTKFKFLTELIYVIQKYFDIDIKRIDEVGIFLNQFLSEKHEFQSFRSFQMTAGSEKLLWDNFLVLESAILELQSFIMHSAVIEELYQFTVDFQRLYDALVNYKVAAEIHPPVNKKPIGVFESMKIHPERATNLLFSNELDGFELDSYFLLQYLLKMDSWDSALSHETRKFISRYLREGDIIGASKFQEQILIKEVNKRAGTTYQDILTGFVKKVKDKKHVEDIESGLIQVGWFEGKYDSNSPPILQFLGEIMNDADITRQHNVLSMFDAVSIATYDDVRDEIAELATPYHDKLLNPIYQKHSDQIISIEVPLHYMHDPQTGEKKLIMGKVDLIATVDGKLLVMDFKPEYHFKTEDSIMKRHLFQTIPQVALYALMLKRLTSLANMPIYCVSFNHEAAYIFKPEVLQKILDPATGFRPSELANNLNTWLPVIKNLMISL